MSIELRDDVVTLYQGSYDKQIRAALEAVARAERSEKAGTAGRRMAAPAPESHELAQKCDELTAEAEKTATKVTVWALDYLEWREFAAEHPPRKDEALDKARGLNMETAPPDLLLLSLVEVPEDEPLELAARRAAGELVLKGLGRMSRNNYMKLSHAAWAVNTADDVVPKSSVLSALQNGSEASSKEPENTG